MRSFYDIRERCSKVFQFSGYCFFTFSLLIIFSNSTYSQWKKIYKFYDIHYEEINSIYLLPQNKQVIFVCGAYKNTPAIWKSGDGGKTWKQVFPGSLLTPWYINTVYSVVFKDSTTGWASIWGHGEIFKTTDAGETWQLLSTIDCWNSILYYNKYSKLLFSCAYGDNVNPFGSALSNDDGASWSRLDPNPPFAYNGGIAFIDPLHGFIAPNLSTSSLVPNRRSPAYTTNDGGITWAKLAFKIPCWQPTSKQGKIFMVQWPRMDDNDGFFTVTDSFFVIDTWGAEPQHRFTFPFLMNGTVVTDSLSLYTQTISNASVPTSLVPGILKSSDDGWHWESICGPLPHGNFPTQVFYADTTGLWVADQVGNLWHNPTGKANPPRLQLFPASPTRNLHVNAGASIPIQLTYPAEAYYEHVDSISLRIMYSGEMIGFDRLSLLPEWQTIRTVSTDSDVICILRYTGTTEPTPSSVMGTIFLRAYISPDTTSTITLDEINYNQDTTYLECMVAALSSIDTIHVFIDPTCNDTTIRAALRKEPVLKILSVTPNPTTVNTTVEFFTVTSLPVEIELLNALGQTISTQSMTSVRGVNTFPVTLPNYPGMFYVRVTAGRYTATEKIVKQ